MKLDKVNKLATLLGLAGMDGTVPLAAVSGLFRPQNAFLLAVLFMAGPAAILTAALMGGAVKERMLAALLAGVIATSIVVLSAGIGPKIICMLNMSILKIAGGISVMAIGFLIMGVKIPEKIPLLIMLLGMAASLVWR